MALKHDLIGKFDYKLPIADLCVADFKTSELPVKIKPTFQSWKDKKLNTRIAIAEACSRNIYYGASCEFSNLPQLQPSSKYYNGVDAYKFLMTFILGFGNSEGAYDPAAKARFMDGWSKLAKRNSQTEQIYRPMLSNLALDCHLIEKAMRSKVKPQHTWLIARELSQQQKGDSILIIGEENTDSHHLSNLTAKIATTVNGKGLLTPSGIGYSHPKDDTSHRIGQKLKSLYRKHNLDQAFYHSQFSELELAFELHDCVFITMEMGTNPEEEKRIINAWNNRTRRDNTLVHLARANRNNRDAEILWTKNNLDNYTSPMDIIGIARERVVTFEKVKLSVLGSIETIASMRLYKQQPSMANIEDLFKDIKIKSSLKAV
jgi:hypothetical protein